MRKLILKTFLNLGSVRLNEDLSIRSIYSIKKPFLYWRRRRKRRFLCEEEKSFEDIYLSELNSQISIHSHNFYTFYKNKNITGVKQQITFESRQDDINEDFEEQKYVRRWKNEI